MALVAVSGGEAPDAKRARTTPARVEAPLELRRALEKLPPLALVPNAFCTYTKSVMQRVPVWKELLPYMVTRKVIMEITRGAQRRPDTAPREAPPHPLITYVRTYSGF